MKRFEKLTLRRSGEFNLRVAGDNHCGVKKDMRVRYEMVCVCKPKLDKRGFLFDQVSVDKFFQEKVRFTRRSCEDLTIKCADEIVKLIKAENATCKIENMQLTLSPEPFAASMTYSYEGGA